MFTLEYTRDYDNERIPHFRIAMTTKAERAFRVYGDAKERRSIDVTLHHPFSKRSLHYRVPPAPSLSVSPLFRGLRP